MLKLMEYEVVDYRQWLTSEEFINMVGATFLFPGLTGVKLSALIGYKAAGISGLILAILALNLPGLLLALIGYKFLLTHSTPITNRIMVVVQYGALALLAAATFSIGQGVIKLNNSLALILLSVIFFIGLIYWDFSPFWGFLLFILIGFFIFN